MSLLPFPSWDVRAEQTSLINCLTGWAIIVCVLAVRCPANHWSSHRWRRGRKIFSLPAYENDVEIGDNLILTYNSFNDKIVLKFGSAKENLIEAVIAAQAGKKDAKGVWFSDPRSDQIFYHGRLKFFLINKIYSSESSDWQFSRAQSLLQIRLGRHLQLFIVVKHKY